MGTELCPCESGQALDECCQPLISGKAKAKTAEQLMRARYTAYTQANMDFVNDTHDPRNRSDLDMEANRKWAEGSKWLGLKIINIEDGGDEDATGTIEFKVKYNSGDGVETHHELSTFKKRSGEWYFHDGKDPAQTTIVRTEAKIGRNDPCPCGSGKKYKKCCGAA